MAGLESFLGGIATGIGDFGKSVFDLFGSGVAGVKDIGTLIATGKVGDETDKFKNWLYGTDNRKDAAYKQLGTTLNGVSTVADFVPGISAGSKISKGISAVTSGIAGNALQGAVGGLADELKESGSNFDWQNAGIRAASGAAAGAATGALGNKINKSLGKAAQTGSKTVLSRIGSNAITRGALTGATGGATAGATSTLLQGGGIGNALGNAVSSGISGGLQGGITGGAMNVLSKAGNKAANWAQEKVIDPLWEKQVNSGAKERLRQALVTGADGNVKFTRLSKEALSDINAVRQAQGMTQLTQRDVTAYKNAINNNLGNRIAEGMTPDDVVEIAYRSLTDPLAEALPGSYQNTIMASPYNSQKYNGSVLGIAADGGTSLKSIEPRDTSQIDAMRTQKNDLFGQSGSPLATNQTGGVVQTRGDSSSTVLGNQRPDLAAAPLGTRNLSVSQNANDVNSDTGYQTSKLAEQGRGKGTTNKMRQLGDYLESRQANATGDQLKHVGIKNAGESIETVRKRTGLTNLQDQAELGKEIVDSITAVRKMAMSATEDGTQNNVDVEPVLKNLDKWAKEQNLAVVLGKKEASEFVQSVRDAIASDGGDLSSKANALKELGATFYGKGSTVANNDPKNTARADYLMKAGYGLDDLSYESIPEGNTEAAYGGIVDLFKKNADIAKNNGNDKIANAYRSIANDIESTPKDSRTIKNLRSYLAPFVQVQKINDITQIRNVTSGKNTAVNLLNPKQLLLNMVGTPIAEQALAKTGGMLNAAADRLDDPQTNFGKVTTSAAKNIGKALSPNISNPTSDVNTALYNIAGRNIGRNETYLPNDTNASAASVLSADSALSGLSSDTTANGLNSATSLASNSAATSTADTTTNPYAKQLNIIGNALQLALDAGDAAAYVQLLSMYNDTYNNYASVEESNSSSGLSSAQQNTILGIQNAFSSLQQLEQMYNEAGGGQGIAGNLSNFLANLGMNSAVSTYNQQSQSLINTIKDAVGKTDSANTQGEVDRLMELIPKITDTQEVANMKINNLYNELQRIYQNTLNNYSGNYSLS